MSPLSKINLTFYSEALYLIRLQGPSEWSVYFGADVFYIVV